MKNMVLSNMGVMSLEGSEYGLEDYWLFCWRSRAVASSVSSSLRWLLRFCRCFWSCWNSLADLPKRRPIGPCEVLKLLRADLVLVISWSVSLIWDSMTLTAACAAMASF